MRRRLLVLALVFVTVYVTTYALWASVVGSSLASIAVSLGWLGLRARTDTRSQAAQAQLDAGLIVASAGWWHPGPHDAPNGPSDVGGYGGGDCGGGI